MNVFYRIKTPLVRALHADFKNFATSINVFSYTSYCCSEDKQL